MIDLDPQQLATVTHILRRLVPDCEVRAFGSRVKGKNQKYSDLDLAIVSKDGSLSQENLDQLREEFATSDLSIIIDIHEWSTMDQDFRQIIQSNYEVLQSS
ncbi:MAG: nucleotidyltransferase domain-containing protein [Magnetococcales bacterium]|nr:nucleotidyltransferase domain-containing protein [Magnetococcales bacterium]NGZ29257.1 nucleotidyltransferase domain-containing protein [Magnetococcales bacterium]